MVDTSVKFFTSNMLAAPKYNNAAGVMISILDACLVNGFGQQTASSAVVAGGKLLLTFVTAHSFMQRAVVRISGITDTGYTALNGDFRVGTVISPTSISLDASGLSDATLASTVTCLLPPLGWNKVFSDTNKAVYQSANPTASGMFFAFDDTAVALTGVRGYESMTGVSTGVGQFPTTTQQATSQWYKVKDATYQEWWLVGDSKTCYLNVKSSSQYRTQPGTYGMGDFIANNSADAYRAFLGSCSNGDSYNNNYAQYTPIGVTDPPYAFIYAPRSYNFLPNAPMIMRPRWIFYNYGSGVANGYASAYGGMPWPNPVDGGLYASDMHLYDTSSIRGRLPGAYATYQAVNNTLVHGSVYAGVSPLNRDLLHLWNIADGVGGGLFFDITGPWQ